MRQPLTRERSIIVGAGIALLVGFFFLPWVKFLGPGRSGFQLVWAALQNGEIFNVAFVVAVMCPIAGLALVSSGLAGNDAAARKVGIATGLIAIGWIAYELVRIFLDVTAFGLWTCLAAAIVAMVVGLRKR